MKRTAEKDLAAALTLLLAFVLFTALVQHVDVQPAGVNGTCIGFAAFNVWFHRLTGVHMGLYTLTDWLGLVPLFVCLFFGGLGLAQLLRRRSLRRVDGDILLLGVYYAAVIAGYLWFEMLPINYRPILINGCMEASYPSSTTLLVLSVMPTLSLQAERRTADLRLRRAAGFCAALFSVFMVLGRLVSGVHWATDTFGAVLLSEGLFLLYRSAVRFADSRKD